MTPEQEQVLRIIAGIVLLASLIIACMCGLTACNMTRTITTTSQYVRRGDTTFVIQTKTTEIVDGTVKYNPFNH